MVATDAARGDETMTTTANCYHCALTNDADDCGAAEVAAVWLDAEGETDGVARMICRGCLDAGAPGGPGYRAVAPAVILGVKDDTGSWETVAGYTATYPDGLAEGSCEVRVDVAAVVGGRWWVIRTADDAGGCDDTPDVGYPTREMAIAAAEALADERDEVVA